MSNGYPVIFETRHNLIFDLFWDCFEHLASSIFIISEIETFCLVFGVPAEKMLGLSQKQFPESKQNIKIKLQKFMNCREKLRMEMQLLAQAKL